MSTVGEVPQLGELKPRIQVIGVGGAGGNALNNMISAGLNGVTFVAANTDAQALNGSSADIKIQLGAKVTEGLGAGSRPELGKAAAEESYDVIKAQVAGAHMAFVTAGMGGGTGTGAAPVVARAAREAGVFTVGVVSKPFEFEGERRMAAAEAGIKELEACVDTLIVIPNQNLFRVADEKTLMSDAFVLADNVLRGGISCITDLMLKEGLINLDFADVKIVMGQGGKAIMGTGQASGKDRGSRAAEIAISNPLLDDVSLDDTSGLLISITGSRTLTLNDVESAVMRIRQGVARDAVVIVGATFDDTLGDEIRVSIVATGRGRRSSDAQTDCSDVYHDTRIEPHFAAPTQCDAPEEPVNMPENEPVHSPAAEPSAVRLSDLHTTRRSRVLEEELEISPADILEADVDVIEANVIEANVIEANVIEESAAVRDHPAAETPEPDRHGAGAMQARFLVERSAQAVPSLAERSGLFKRSSSQNAGADNGTKVPASASDSHRARPELTESVAKKTQQSSETAANANDPLTNRYPKVNAGIAQNPSGSGAQPTSSHDVSDEFDDEEVIELPAFLRR